MINGTEDLDFVKRNLITLARGNELIDRDGNILHIYGVTLLGANESIDEATEYDMEHLNELDVYINPLQVKIDTMQLTIDRLTADLVLAHAPKVKGKYNHLNKAEVREIEMIFENKPNTNRELIANTYNSSQPVISRIATGVHVKTSSQYVSFLSRINND